VTHTGEATLASSRERTSIVAGLAVGACLTWNVSNIGAVADPLAATYGTSLAVIGLLTTSLFVAHLAAQLPAGIGADRYGARAVAIAAIGLAVAGNAIVLTAPNVGVAAIGRAVVGLGSGAGFVAGLDLVRAGGGGAVSQGIYGGATMAGGGLALMTLPAITAATSWRAPFWTAILLALAAAIPTLAAPTARHAAGKSGSLGNVSDLLPLGAVQAGSFGLSVIAGNWVVTLLEREGAGSTLAGVAGGLTLLAGIVSRPWGGIVVRQWRAWSRAAVAASIVAGALGTALLAAGLSLGVSAVAALLLGLSAGFPFAAVFDATVRLRPGAPAAAIGLVNGCAVLAILVGTPLAGLTFSLSGDGRIGFAVMAVLWGTSLLALRATTIGRPPEPLPADAVS
jgi:predicted MFS family arabinose efflux permease